MKTNREEKYPLGSKLKTAPKGGKQSSTMVGLFKQSIIKVQQKRRAGGMGEAVEVIYLDYYELLKQIIVNDLLIIILYELLLAKKKNQDVVALVGFLLLLLVIVHMCNNKTKTNKRNNDHNKIKTNNNMNNNNFDFGCCKCRNCRRPHCHYF